ncbi:dihydropteroate synthase [Cellulomonas marina]|uniref:Inactive dihydropteroate synthase 2 n=1 Tax=Cellulomonas marina TaxID=988821 RepID=A0A1I0ZHX9_9CELL|nr:dihydropteroate synthase [Cellulomonas marina]GIG28612.1 inactive dihydropteroate synthase 2 [Cellulomonas marina]SFB25389.1 dihydropteroate synthase [Cellulomonas marina]
MSGALPGAHPAPGVPDVPPAGPPVRLGGRTVGVDHPLVMAVVNRTPDSFYAAARHTDGTVDAAVDRAVAEGADLVDIGGVRAGRGPRVDVAEEVERVVPVLARVRRRHPDLLLSVDTWRAPVARAAADAGADLLNDTWAGWDPGVAEVAAERDLGLVVSHTGGARPRTDPLRVTYPLAEGAPGDEAAADPLDGVLQDVLRTLAAGARRAVDLGVHPRSVLVDPTHDFGKTTWHSLHLVRRTQALVGLGHPVLMALSRKDFVGESLGLPPEERLEGTLAATVLAAWWGARVFRTHDVRAARRALDMVAVLRGDRAPERTVRGLA